MVYSFFYVVQDGIMIYSPARRGGIMIAHRCYAVAFSLKG
jgi:hypothetical protein